MNIIIKKHIELLGLRMEDKVTGFSGVVTSVCFDLYGCVQGLLSPGIDKNGKTQEPFWFDVQRLTGKKSTPVMDRPDFDFGAVAEGKRGAAEKPIPTKS